MNDFEKLKEFYSLENINSSNIYDLIEFCLNKNIPVSVSVPLLKTPELAKKYILDLKKESRRCSSCIYKEELCISCSENPIYKNIPRNSKFALYKHTCPYGHKDCVNDPAYIKFFHKNIYKNLYKDLSPEQVSEIECKPNYEKDKDKTMDFYCYSDEDK